MPVRAFTSLAMNNAACRPTFEERKKEVYSQKSKKKRYS
jgi:hypothetical protein